MVGLLPRTAFANTAPPPDLGPLTARVEPVTETFFGTSVTDNYRWMENAKDKDWAPFMQSQNEHCRMVLAAIPGNDALSPACAEARRREIFDPYHARIDAVIGRRLSDRMPTVLVALHSFTPVYAGVARPWHIGTLYHRDTSLPPLLLRALRAEADLVVGDNEPYAVSDLTDYTIPVHGEARGLINSGIEIRQDLIAEASGQRQWAERLPRILGEVEATLRAKRLI